MLNVLIYTHNTRGLGHAARAVAIASQLSKLSIRPNIICVGGVDLGATGWIPPFVEYVKLPSYSLINSPAGYSLGSATLNIPKKQLTDIRSALINTLLNKYNPNLVIVDLLPKGKQNELAEPLKKWKKKHPNSALCFSLRGIIGSNKYATKNVLDNSSRNFLEKYYDRIWVFSDRRIINVEKEYSFSSILSEKTKYFGYITKLHPSNLSVSSDVKRKIGVLDNEKLIIVGLGSGWQAESIIDRVIQAIKDVSNKRLIKCKILLGPKLNSAKLSLLEEEIRNNEVFLKPEYRPDISSLLNSADLFIGRGGYNTISEVLLANLPAIIIPRPDEEQEQEIHAARLQNNNFLYTEQEATLTVSKLAQKINDVLFNNNILFKKSTLEFCNSSKFELEISELNLNSSDGEVWSLIKT